MEFPPEVFSRGGVARGEYAELRVEQSRTLELTWRGGELTAPGMAFDEGGCARVVTTRGSSFVSFTGRDYAGAIRAARAQVVLLDPVTPGLLAPVDPVTGHFGQPEGPGVSLAEKAELLAGYARRIAGCHPAVTGSVVHFRESVRRVHLVTVHGTDVEYEQADLTLQVTVYAGSGAAMAAGSLSVGSAGDFRVVAGLEPRVEEACQAAVDSAAAPACEPGSYDVVCDGSLAGIWAHETVGHLAEADHQQPGAAPAVTGPPFLTVIDSGGLPGQRGHVAIDDEGVRCADVDLIRDGVIGGRLHSRATASLFGEAPTGNARAVGFRHPPIPRLRTTRILTGPHRIEEMIGATRHGLLAAGFYGGQTDRLSFAFTPARCRRITGGEVRGLVRPPVLSGTIAGTLARIDMIGDRSREDDTSASCGKLGQWPLPVSSFAPPIRVRGLDAG